MMRILRTFAALLIAVVVGLASRAALAVPEYYGTQAVGETKTYSYCDAYFGDTNCIPGTFLGAASCTLTEWPRTATGIRTLSNTRSPRRKPGSQGAVWSRTRRGPSPARAPMGQIEGRRATSRSGCTAVRARSASGGHTRGHAVRVEPHAN